MRKLMTLCAFMCILTLVGAVNAYAMTWYGPGYCGNLTSSGDVFDCSAYTAAHPILPFGTLVEVCYDGCVVVTINDRGPVLDLSPAAADAIGLDDVGAAPDNWTVL